MNKEDKSLLLQDLSARLPYGVIVKYRSREGEGDVQLGCGNIGYVLQLGNGWWKECKPYLRSMSSMTKEEYEELRKIDRYYGIAPLSEINDWEPGYKSIDWLLRHHFDFRGLIPKGLAIEAPEGMYNIK